MRRDASPVYFRGQAATVRGPRRRSAPRWSDCSTNLTHSRISTQQRYAGERFSTAAGTAGLWTGAPQTQGEGSAAATTGRSSSWSPPHLPMLKLLTVLKLGQHTTDRLLDELRHAREVVRSRPLCVLASLAAQPTPPQLHVGPLAVEPDRDVNLFGVAILMAMPSLPCCPFSWMTPGRTRVIPDHCGPGSNRRGC